MRRAGKQSLSGYSGDSGGALAEPNGYTVASYERGDLVEKGESSGNYYIAMWQRADLVAILEPLGFREIWSSSEEDADGRWLTILATKDGANEKERLAAT